MRLGLVGEWISRQKKLLTVFLILVLLVTLALGMAQAAPANVETESGIVGGNAMAAADATASGNGIIRFGATDTAECGSIGPGGYPLPNLTGYSNACNTGPRYECTDTVGPITTTSNGQVIEGICTTRIDVQHDNVTIRDTLIMSTGTYALDIGEDIEEDCPTNLLVEYSEINMANAGNIDWAVYQRCIGATGVHTFDHVTVQNSGRLMMMEGGIVITNSYFYSYRTTPTAHRTALSTHGGDNYTVTGNTFICYEDGCSSSVNMYSDYAPVTNYLFQGNVLSGGTICLRAGNSHTYAADAHDIRVINNRFSAVYNPECGCNQAFGAWDPAKPGNEESGNVWHEDSEWHDAGDPVQSNFSFHYGCGPYEGAGL